MAVRYLPIDGESVSAEWLTVLLAMRHGGVSFRVNEGHRTMARQLYFWNLYRSGKGNLAAFPSPNAPHIRTGRIDHAIDFWNDSAVFVWLDRHGLHPVRTVRGESWHIEITADRLREFARTHGVERNPLKGLGPLQKLASSRLLFHRREMAREKRTGEGPRFRKQLKFARRWKARVEKYLRTAKGGQHVMLERVLAAKDGRL